MIPWPLAVRGQMIRQHEPNMERSRYHLLHYRVGRVLLLENHLAVTGHPLPGDRAAAQGTVPNMSTPAHATSRKFLKVFIQRSLTTFVFLGFAGSIQKWPEPIEICHPCRPSLGPYPRSERSLFKLDPYGYNPLVEASAAEAIDLDGWSKEGSMRAASGSSRCIRVCAVPGAMWKAAREHQGTSGFRGCERPGGDRIDSRQCLPGGIHGPVR